MLTRHYYVWFLALVLSIAAAKGNEGARRRLGQEEEEEEASQPVSLNVILTNDDGFETEFIQALYHALEGAGHNVVMSAPYAGQSGTSGFIRFLQPILPTSEDSPEGTISAGSFGIGETTLGEQQYYADTTPAGAVLFGIDVLAPRIFGGPPDLVISGPNEGNNIGLVTPHSGTIGAAVTAINKGIPTIAVSGPQTGNAQLVAALTVKVVDAIVGKDGEIALPIGSGLNVNIPETTSENVHDYAYVYTTLSAAADFGLQFFEDLGDSPIATGFGIPPGFPGVSVTIPYTAAGYPVDNNENAEGNVFDDLIVTVSPIEGLYASDDKVAKRVEIALKSLFN